MPRSAKTPPGWTPGLRLRIAVLADIHAGMPAMPMERFQEIVALASVLGERDGGVLGILKFDRDRISELIKRGVQDAEEHDCAACGCCI